MEGIFDINNTDTICAISTPPGRGGIAVVRISGPRAVETVTKIWEGASLSLTRPRTALYGRLMDGNELLDQAIATVFRAPASFTGDDTVEISVHGSPYVQRRLLQLLTSDPAMCRLALPGEFTRRAFLSGKIDLSQAEAVGDLIAASSRGAHRLAVSQLGGNLARRINTLRERLIDLASLLELELDFSEEDIEFASRERLISLATRISDILDRLSQSFSTGNAILNGIPVAIAGAPNAGKSTLLNRLLDYERAIVSDIPGTTRDIIEDTAEISGRLFRFTDTAGLRTDTTDIIEQEGIRRAKQRIQSSDIILYLFDSTQSPSDSAQLHAWDDLIRQIDHTPLHLLPVINKTDLSAPQAIQQWQTAITTLLQSLPSGLTHLPPILHSSSDDTSLHQLQDRLLQTADTLLAETDTDDPILTNTRQLAAVTSARSSIQATLSGLRDGLSPDLIAQHLRHAITTLGEITGAITTPDLLTTIFSRFCIGK